MNDILKKLFLILISLAGLLLGICAGAYITLMFFKKNIENSLKKMFYDIFSDNNKIDKEKMNDIFKLFEPKNKKTEDIKDIFKEILNPNFNSKKDKKDTSDEKKT